MMGDEKIKESVLKSVGMSFRFKVLSEIHMAMARHDVSYELIAVRLEWDYKKVEKLLSGRDDMSIRQVGEIVFAIDGATIVFDINDNNDESDPV